LKNIRKHPSTLSVPVFGIIDPAFATIAIGASNKVSYDHQAEDRAQF
jgi:hypothetical protein